MDTLRAVKENFRFFGQAKIQPTERAQQWAEEWYQTEEVEQCVKIGDFVEAMYQGTLGTRDEGAYPGRAGRDTVTGVK